MMKKNKPGVQCPIKTKDKVEDAVKRFFSTHHHVNLSHMHGLGQQIVTLVVNDLQAPIHGSQNIFKFLSTWFKTTNIKGMMEEHSAHGFCLFMDNNYDFIVVDKKATGLKKWLTKLLKVL